MPSFRYIFGCIFLPAMPNFELLTVARQHTEGMVGILLKTQLQLHFERNEVYKHFL